ncbi:MAG: AraC family transcriptional regulator [Spirochaetes bacterium]|nr:AraC family transcriptional regulator [Spirochaetota bacterium]
MIKERSMFQVLPEFDNMELLNATYITHSFTVHYHQEYCIGVMLSGAQETDYRHSKQVMPEGTICVLNPGITHTGRSYTQKGWTYRMLYPGIKLLKSIAAQISEKPMTIPFFPELVIKDQELFIKILNLHMLLENPASSSLEKESALVSTLSQLLIRYAEEKPEEKNYQNHSFHIHRVIEYLNDHFDQEISLGLLAQIAGLSPFYFLRLFKKATGLTPHIYLTHRKIESAKSFLKKGYPISEVAYLTGFTDQSHLTNRFKSISGITPGQFQQNLIQ